MVRIKALIIASTIVFVTKILENAIAFCYMLVYSLVRLPIIRETAVGLENFLHKELEHDK